MADVLDRVIAHDRDGAGVLVDLDLDDVAAVREGALAAVERVAREQTGPLVRRRAGCSESLLMRL